MTVGTATRWGPSGLDVDVCPGPSLLAGIDAGPSLTAHRSMRGDVPRLTLPELLPAAIHLDGRGGAGFPLSRKLEGLARARRPPVVVNLAEGEPVSAKDAVLAALAPHLVLDGAVAAAYALGSREVHLVVPGERDVVALALQTALSERDHGRWRFRLHRARPGFVSGQSRAVLELIEGRENRPVTSWESATVSGLGGRPTLLSNAETFAQLAARLLRPLGPSGIPNEPGTTLLTLAIGDARPLVREVELGTPWAEVLQPDALRAPVLVGGYHGCWVPPNGLADLPVSRRALADRGLSLGAGVVMVAAGCPVRVTAHIAAHLALESAGRCGPCVRGLPTLAHLVGDLAAGRGEVAEVRRIAALVDGRGACAHPDGTARLVRSMLEAYGTEVEEHAHGRCRYLGRGA